MRHKSFFPVTVIFRFSRITDLEFKVIVHNGFMEKLKAVLRAKPYTFAKLYILHMQNYVLCTVYTFAYAKTYTFAKHIVLHMQNYMFCLTNEKLHILNKKATRTL